MPYFPMHPEIFSIGANCGAGLDLAMPLDGSGAITATGWADEPAVCTERANYFGIATLGARLVFAALWVSALLMSGRHAHERVRVAGPRVPQASMLPSTTQTCPLGPILEGTARAARGTDWAQLRPVHGDACAARGCTPWRI